MQFVGAAMLEAAREMPDKTWQEEKAMGNSYFKNKEFIAAARVYGFALARLKDTPFDDEKEKDSISAILFCNRAMALLKTKSFEGAEDDATIVLAVVRKMMKKFNEPASATYFKALYRRAMAREGLKDFEGALEDWSKLANAQNVPESLKSSVDTATSRIQVIQGMIGPLESKEEEKLD